MFVATSYGSRIINKTIVYSDTVLSLKELGKNLKVTTIPNVSECSLKHCLETIFESNPNVIFNTIQYSRKDKKVYFYTNQDIATEAYEESKFKKYKPITSRTEILEEVKKVLLLPKNKDNDCVSLYDVLIILRKLNDKYNNIVKEYKYRLDYMVSSKIDGDSLVCFHSINFKKKIINISFKKNKNSNWDDMYFAKQNEDLYVEKSESSYTYEVFSALCSTLSEMYDELLKYDDYKDSKYTKYDIKPVNSNFSIKIDYCGVCLFVKDSSNKYVNELELFAPSYKSGYELKCNSSIVNEVFNGKESEIFKNIFIKISDCPEWSRDMLCKIRQEQLPKVGQQCYRRILSFLRRKAK